MDPYSTGQFRIGPEAEVIESAAWLAEFTEGYIAGWNSGDGAAVAKCATEDTMWYDPSLGKRVAGRAGVEEFVSDTVRSFPDVAYTNPFPPLLAAEGRAAVVPWRMTGTHLGPIDPPGFAATGKKIDLLVIDIWQFRGGLIWRSQATWDLSEMLLQLGLMPPRGSTAERAMARAQRVRSRLPF
ncbi:ester cyclase [Nocardia iowensis]|uniref:Ester cyclase n=1 Tax=Nocardia iowensis TaxID=204891 RepID=A0ABX8RLP9_NOCIO|nr:nuclear transport factor 2 family protein [Nocardia iowensis]QXN89937.1 ester cyclase [Nocardia iowensis]